MNWALQWLLGLFGSSGEAVYLRDGDGGAGMTLAEGLGLLLSFSQM